MSDFKKDSLLENYNRIVRAKNQRLDEQGYYLGGESATSDTEETPVQETIGPAFDEVMKIMDAMGAEETLKALVQAMDEQVVMEAVEYIKRMYEL